MSVERQGTHGADAEADADGDGERYGGDVDELEQEQYGGGRQSIGSRACGVIGCLLVITLLVGLGAAAFALGNALEPLADRYLWAPHDVVREYFDAWRRDDRPRMQRFLCEGVNGVLDPQAPFDHRVGSPYVEDDFPYPRPGGRLAIYYRL
ncbi:MAG: hypothetical protein M3N29_02685 [Chloroflexota bacterium]|nr:hypothetical protein [Chloroflexota bacterium]